MVKIILQLVFGGFVVESLVSTCWSIGKIGVTCCDIGLLVEPAGLVKLVEYWWNLVEY